MPGALYRVDYQSFGTGGAVVYIGDDGVTGIDVAGGIWSGYITRSDRARGQIKIHFPQGGQLVTGQTMAPGQNLVVDLDVQRDFDNGQDVDITLFGAPMRVRFTLISAIPIPGGAMPLQSTTGIDGGTY